MLIRFRDLLDPGSGLQDPGWISGIRHKHPGSAIMLSVDHFVLDPDPNLHVKKYDSGFRIRYSYNLKPGERKKFSDIS
jgi:hypothetical protein